METVKKHRAVTSNGTEGFREKYQNRKQAHSRNNDQEPEDRPKAKVL